jgi:16S rRNA processing protein RimM
MTEEDYVIIGQITGVHGLHGSLKVNSHTDSLDLYKKGEQLLIRGSGKALSIPERCLTIQSVSPYKKKILLKFDEISDIDSAERLIGADIFIPREKFPELEDGEFYWVDIIGLSVFTVNGESLGRVDSIFPTGSNDVYVVKGKGKEILIPALESVIRSIDLDAGVMTVELPEGL